MKIWQKITLSVMLGGNIIFMFMPWFGALKGVQEVSGTIVLINPITIICIGLILAGIWIKKIGKMQNPLIYTGFTGIIIMEVYNFFTWYTKTIHPGTDIITSFNMVFPEYYLGLMLTVAALTTAILFGYCRYKKEGST